MNIADAASEFERFAIARGIAVQNPGSVLGLAETWLAFFAEVRAADASVDEGDMPDALLFAFGYREALPDYHDACFYVCLTRQFVASEGEDDDAMFQLVWMAEYEPTAELLALGHRSEWCDSLQALPHFGPEVLADPVFKRVAGLVPGKIDFYLTGV